MPKISVLTPSIRPRGLVDVQESLAFQTFKDFEWIVEMGIPEQGHDLNAAFNRMLRRAKGELIVFYEDWMRIKPIGLDIFWDAYLKNPKFYTAPVGKTLNWSGVSWDWRKERQHIKWNEWEIDWACAPRKALVDIGGFDEELDQYWTFDNVNVGFRADMAGYEFGCLTANEAIVYDHDKAEAHPFRHQINKDFHNSRLSEFKSGLKLDYLKE